ncbi:MAG: hypothetical protein ABEL51_03525 [Salinibacter sp.]
MRAKVLAPGAYDVAAADTVRGSLNVGKTGEEEDGEIKFRSPAEEGPPPLDFNPRVHSVTIQQDSTVFPEVFFPSEKGGTASWVRHWSAYWVKPRTRSSVCKILTSLSRSGTPVTGMIRFGLLTFLWTLLGLLALRASAASAQAPADCDTTYADARTAYYAAEFDRAEQLLRPCVRQPTVPDSMRVRLYRLLSFVYLGQNDSTAARRSVESLLDLRPTYTPRPSRDRPDFVALVKRAKAARKARATAKTDESDRRWVRWALGIGAAVLGTAAVLLFGGGDSDDGPQPLPRPEPPPE